VYELRITFRLGSLEISSRCAKQTLDFRYQRNIELIASESSADEVLSIHIFTRLARMAALERIGHHTGSFSFHMPHTPDTFLVPLLDPVNGEELTFIYEPTVSSSGPSSSNSRSSIPKHRTSEMNDLLVKQYPPIFHAATNISSFICAFNAMPFL